MERGELGFGALSLGVAEQHSLLIDPNAPGHVCNRWIERCYHKTAQQLGRWPAPARVNQTQQNPSQVKLNHPQDSILTLTLHPWGLIRTARIRK